MAQKNNKTKTVYFAVVQEVKLPSFFSDEEIKKAIAEISEGNDFVFGTSPDILEGAKGLSNS